MNTHVQDGNTDPQNGEVVEVVAPAEGASDEERADYIKKLEDQNKQLFARTKKAEGFVQDKDGKWVKPASPSTETERKPDATTEKKDTSNLSQADLIWIAKSDVHQEDIPELIEYAKFKGISIIEASADPIMKGILAGKAEQRKIAEGTNTGGGKRGNAKKSDEALIEDARNGKLPESEDDMRRLTILQRTKK